MVELVLEVEEALSHPIAAVGVTVPGIIHMKKGTVELMPNFPDQWRGVALQAYLKSILQLPVYMLNDARAATYAEKKFGVAKPYDNFVSFIIGTGVGGGIVHKGQLLLGSRGVAGELGHQIVEPHGLPCGCGNRGCLETVVSGPAIVTAAIRYIKQGAQTNMRSLIQGDINVLTPEIVNRAALSGDAAALEIFQSVASYINRAILNVKAILNPEAIVFGGGVAQSELLLKMIKEEVKKNNDVLFPHALGEMQIERSTFSDLSGAIGAAAWAIDLEERDV